MLQLIDQAFLPQILSVILEYLGLLTTESHLSGHDALSLGDERAFGAGTVPPATVALVAFQSGDDAVVAATGAFRGALVALGRPQEQSGRGRGGGRRDAGVRWHVLVMLVQPLEEAGVRRHQTVSRRR